MIAAVHVNILGPHLDAAASCEAVLRSLPAWFGIEEALQMYASDSARLPGFAIVEGERLLGFVSLHRHFPDAWELHCMAVHADARGRGLGRMLLAHTERWLIGQGARWLQVKTVAATSDSKAYAQTRAFYERLGFEPLEVFPTLWSPSNPCLQLIKSLR